MMVATSRGTKSKNVGVSLCLRSEHHVEHRELAQHSLTELSRWELWSCHPLPIDLVLDVFHYSDSPKSLTSGRHGPLAPNTNRVSNSSGQYSFQSEGVG